MFDLHNLGFGFEMLLIGMIVVFSALTIICLVVMLIGKFFTKKKTAEKKTSEVVAPAPVADITEVVEDSSQIVAVLTAAICAYEDKPLGSFRVVSFKKR